MFSYALLAVFLISVLIILFQKPKKPDYIEQSEKEIKKINELRQEEIKINREILLELKAINSKLKWYKVRII